MSQESDLLEMGLMARECSGFGATFQYGTITGPCSLGAIGFGGRIVSSGISPNAETKVVIRKTVLPDAELESGQPLSVTDRSGKSRALKIATEGIEDLIYAWEITCNDPNQNA
jgi:hypothetical protein